MTTELDVPTALRTPYADVVETHSGVVVFLGDRAYKFKKPVDLGFLDFRSRESRRHACEGEIALNRRLAPDVYLGLGGLTEPGADDTEPVVVMQRLPADRRLSTMAGMGGDLTDHLTALARLLAEFHSEARRDVAIDAHVTATALGERWRKHLDELRSCAADVLPSEDIDRIQDLVMRYLAGRSHLFEERIHHGWIREGHGDLLADDIFCLDDGPRVLDCLDFDEQLRWVDVLDDVAFLVMDLERLERADLGEQLLAKYDEFSGEVHPVSLLHHYVAYRASVRSKVAAIRHRQDRDDESAEEARLLARIALDHLEAGRLRLVLVGGLPGTGKSTLAEALASKRNWTVLSSDVVRKELAGMAPASSAAATWQSGLYQSEHTSLTYCALLRRATHALCLGESVIIDASWSDASVRGMAADLACRASADLVELQCVSEASVAMERIAQRQTMGASASDATQQIARRMAEEADAWPSAHRIDTTYTVAESLAQATSAVDGMSPY